MKLKAINCPNCNYPLQDADVQPNQFLTCSACQTTLVVTDLVTADTVICVECQTISPASQRFCDTCGSALTAGCPFCYTDNTINAIHCKQCGANLQRARQRKHSWRDERRKHQAERRAALNRVQASEEKAQIQILLNDLNEPKNHPKAIYALHQLGAKVVEDLISHLTSEDPDVRFGVAQTLGLIGDPRAIPPLIQALQDSDPTVRYWAVDALGKLKAENAIKPIGERLQDEHKEVREQAADVLKEIGGPEAEKILRKNKRKWWQF